LFHRTKRRLVLTEEGARFFKETERILRNISDLPQIASDIRATVSQSLRIIAMPRVLGGVVSPSVASFRHEHPETALTVDVLRRSRLGEWIEGRSFDVGFGTFPLDERSLEVLPLVRTPLMVAMRPDDTLASEERVTAEALLSRGQIAFPRGTFARRQTDEMMQSAGVEPRYDLETSDYAFACQQCIHAGSLLVVDPVSVRVYGDALVFRPLWTTRWIQFGTFLPLDVRRSSAVDTLIDLVQTQCAILVAEGLAESLDPEISKQVESVNH